MTRGRSGVSAVPSRPPLQEILDQRQTQRLALFRVELRSKHVVAADAGGHRLAVFGGGEELAVVGRLQMIGVDEIGVQPRLAVGDAVEQRVRLRKAQRVPAHVRHLEAAARLELALPARRSSRGRHGRPFRGHRSPSAACRRRCRGTARRP